MPTLPHPTRRSLLTTLPLLPACVPAHPPASPSQPPITIELLASLTPDQHATLQATLLDPFQRAHPGTRLTILDHPPTQLDQHLLTLTAAGTPPDVTYNAPPALYLAGLTQDLTDRLRRDRYDTGAFVKDGFESAATWRGKVVGLPYYFGGHSSVLPYNRDLFHAAGLPEPPARWGAPDWTAGAWLHALQRTTTHDSDGAVRAYGTNVTLYTFYAFYLSTLFRGAWLSDDLRTVTCDSPPMIEAFEFFAALTARHRVAATPAHLAAAFGDSSPEKAFLGGRLAMYATPGAQNVAPIPAAVRTRGLPLAYAPLPRFKTFGAAHYYLTNGLPVRAPHPDHAWAYVKWAADTPAWSISRGQPPAKPALFDAWAGAVYHGIQQQVRLHVYAESLQHPLRLDPLFHVPAPHRTRMTDLIQSGLERLWAGDSPAATLRALRLQLQPLVPADLP